MATETIPWLDDMRASLGVQEIKGKGSNPRIVGYFADCGWALDELGSDDSVAWCAARVGSALKQSGYPVPPKDVNLTARTYAKYGTPCEPKPGAIGTIPRGGSSWMGHVFVIEEVMADGTWQTIGGNQGKEGYGKVSRATIDPSKTEILGVRWPVAATVPALRAAGSTEIALGDTLHKAAVAAPVVAAVAKAADALVVNPAPAPALKETLQLAADNIAISQRILEGTANVGKLVIAHPWMVVVALFTAALILAGWRLKANRVKRAAAGAALSRAG